jgi:hypothetical protein
MDAFSEAIMGSLHIELGIVKLTESKVMIRHSGERALPNDREQFEQFECAGVHRALAPDGDAAAGQLLAPHGSAQSGTSVHVSLARRQPPPVSQEETHRRPRVDTPSRP